MTYKIDFHSTVRKYLRQLNEKESHRIVKKIKSIQANPFRYLEHYEGDSLYKLRIGDYRALIDVDFEKKLLIVQVLDKRGRVYKR